MIVQNHGGLRASGCAADNADRPSQGDCEPSVLVHRHDMPVDESPNPESPIPSTIGVSSVKSHHYSQHAAALRTELGRALPRETLVALHKKDAARHLLVAARQFAILALCTWGLIAIPNPLIWIPLAFVQVSPFSNLAALLLHAL